MPLTSCWIIEDEPPALRRLTRLLGQAAPGVSVTFTTDSVSALRAALRQRPHPDFVLSDIHLADGLSLDAWEEGGCDCPIIFTTAYDEYGIRAFHVNSIDYLLKPVEVADLAHSLEKLARLRPEGGAPDWARIAAMVGGQTPTYRSRFLAQRGNELVPVRAADLGQLYSEDGLTFALTRDRQRLLLSETLDRLTGELDPAEWFRINRAQIVHLNAVRRASPYFNHRLHLDLRPDAGLDNIVSRARVADFKQWLGG